MFDVEEKKGRLILTLNRAPVNAINDVWLERLHSILGEIEKREDIAILHIRSGQKVFCAGMDVEHIRMLTERPDGADAMVADVEKFQQVFSRIEAMPQVVLAEIGGAALGGGLELALACDLRVASHRAKIGLPEARLGLIPGAGGTQRLTRLCGRGIASRMILSGEVIDGATAAQIGIVQWSFDHDALEAETASITARIAELSPAAVREAKALIAAALDHRRDGFTEEREADRRLFKTEDTQSRLIQFLESTR